MEQQVNGGRLRTWLKANATTMIVSASIGGLVAAAPTIAATVSNAVNADKVDGIHARSYTTSKSKRKNKLVAANSSGYLPNNIIQKADNANTLDGIDSSSFVRRSHIIHVTAGSSSASNGTSLLSALSSAGAAATSAQPYLVQLEPGTYDVGNGQVDLPAFVHLAGSGETATTITGTGYLFDEGANEYRVLRVTHPTEIRDLTVEISGGTTGDGTTRAAIHSVNSGATVRRVKAIADGEVYSAIGLAAYRVGIYAEDGPMTIIDSDLYAKDGYYNAALWAKNNPTPVVVRQSRLTSKGGGVTYWGAFASSSGAIMIDGSQIEGTQADLYVQSSTIAVLNSIIRYGNSGGPGTLICRNTYTESLDAVDAGTCSGIVVP